MSDALQRDIDNVRENQRRCEAARIKEEDVIFKTIHNDRRFNQAEREKMEKRITTNINNTIKTGMKWFSGIIGVVFMLLIGALGFFIKLSIDQVMSRLPK